MTRSPIHLVLTPLRHRKLHAFSALAWRAVFVLAPMQAPIAVGLIVAALSDEPPRAYAVDVARLGMDPVKVGVAILLCVGIVTAISAYARSVSMARLSRAIVAELRVRGVDSALAMPHDEHERLGAIEIHDRIVNDTASVRRFIDRVFVQAIINVVRIGYPTLMLFMIEPTLALIVFALLLPQTLVSARVLRRIHDATRRVRSQRSRMNRAVAELVRKRAHDSRDVVVEHVGRLESEEMRSQHLSALNMANVWFFTGVGITIAWIIGAAWVADGRLGLGQLVAFTGMLAFVHQPMRQFTLIANTSRRGAVALERLDEMMAPMAASPSLRLTGAPTGDPREQVG